MVSHQPDFCGDRMQVGHVLVAGERMADQHGIGALGIERAVGLVGDLERRELDAGIELERLVGPETRRVSDSCGWSASRGASAASRGLLRLASTMIA